MAITVSVNENNYNTPTAVLVEKPIISATNITSSAIVGRMIEVVKISTGEPGGEEHPTVILPFTQSELINGRLIKLHNLNRRVVKVNVTNEAGIEFQPRVNNLADNSRVEIDLSRFEITGTWYLSIS